MTDDYRTLLEETGFEEMENHRDGRQVYYWILSKDLTTERPVILGPYNTEEEANQVGFEKIDSGNFEVIPLGTRNVQRANRLLKYRRFHQEAKLEEVLKRAKHRM